VAEILAPMEAGERIAWLEADFVEKTVLIPDKERSPGKPFSSKGFKESFFEAASIVRRRGFIIFFLVFEIFSPVFHI
jgi:hypothetical protein